MMCSVRYELSGSMTREYQKINVVAFYFKCHSIVLYSVRYVNLNCDMASHLYKRESHHLFVILLLHLTVCKSQTSVILHISFKFKMGCKKGRKRGRKMKTDDVDCLVDSVGGESQVKSVSSQKLGQSDANESDSESDSDSSSDEDMVCSGKGYRIWEWDQLRYLITTSLVTASKDCQYVSTSPIQAKCADVNTMHSGNEEYWTWEVSSKEI